MRNIVPFEPRAGPASGGGTGAVLGPQQVSIAGAGAPVQQSAAFAVGGGGALHAAFEVDSFSSPQQDVMMVFLLEDLIGNLEVALKSSTVLKICAGD